MTFKTFVNKYQQVPTIYRVGKPKLYKVRVIDNLCGLGSSFLDMIGEVFVAAKSKNQAQIEVRKLAREHRVDIKTGFAVEVK